jgi:hypothetical protein
MNMSNTLTKKRRLINYLYDGGGANNGITANEAKSKFGVSNLRATISDIRDLVEAHGERTYAFDTDGSRYMM